MTEHRVLTEYVDRDEPADPETWVQIPNGPVIMGGAGGVVVAAFGDPRQVYRQTNDGRTWKLVAPLPEPILRWAA